MRKLTMLLCIIAMSAGLVSAAHADFGWQTQPILGYDSEYTGNVVIYTTTGPVVIPYDDPDGIVTTGQSMDVFYVGQSVHTGSGVYLNTGHNYNWTSVFTNGIRTVSYSGAYTPGDEFFMVWNTPDGGGDGNGLSTLTAADVGHWTYTETWTQNSIPTSIVSVREFEVKAVPEPMSVMLGLLGLSSVAGLRRLRRK